MTDHLIYLALGTNIGDRMQNLQVAVASMPPNIDVVACSSVYETPPWGVVDQPAFYNQVICGRTKSSPEELLAYVKSIEKKMGRVPTVQNGPRLIDIDILFYDDLIQNSVELGLPHPRMEGRAFVWIPLAELAPDLRHPILEKTAKEVAKMLDNHTMQIVSQESPRPLE